MVAGGAVAINPTPAAGNLEALRHALDTNSRQLLAIIDPPWQNYLALPKDVYERGAQSNPNVLSAILQRYDMVAKSGNYQQLAERPEFVSTYEVLREYIAALSTPGQSVLQLPPPPVSK